jgi:hypothetical protein
MPSETRVYPPKYVTKITGVKYGVNLTKAERETYAQCLGNCRICLCEGGCDLEKKLVKGA